MQHLAGLGWTGHETEHWQQDGEALPGRVAIMHGPAAEVIWYPGGEERHELFHLTSDLPVSPVAGDWVTITDGALTGVLPRRASLTRPDPNGKDVQVMASNMDLILIALPIDRGLNRKAAERLSVMAWDSGAQPVIVLTKADGAADAEAEAAAAAEVAPGVDVIVTSSLSGEGVARLRELMADRTSVLLGASGAGKTSLLNALEGREEAVREVRRDGEGRHTTTTRKLYRLSSGGVLLDIPGIRALDLLASEDGLEETFADIAELAAGCQFADCAHEGDKGCAVEAAIASGELPARRLESWRTIRREMAYQNRRNDPEAMAAQRQKWKAMSKESRTNKR
ncbi:ribosome small subunit-dependent GTPase A [Longispora albida]|uniref:ribosome small subunit-dependent GTPase A n=1 Tax=Longispora albida TaxID=203523 RepID=UPI00037DDB3B|nr:ribosome small subunit-dependent GTPase A [Longispora albida]